MSSNFNKCLLEIFCIAVVIISSGEVPVSGDDQATIRWRQIKGARGYFVQIRDNAKKIVLRKYTRENYLIIDLSNGTYQVRVAGVNKFRKPGRWSRWTTLTVRRLVQPDITAVVPGTLERSDRMRSIKIVGSRFLPESEVRLTRNGDVYDRFSIIEHGTNRMTIFLNSSDFKPGRYTVTVVNPGGATAVYKSGLTITEQKVPVVSQVKKPKETTTVTDSGTPKDTETVQDTENGYTKSKPWGKNNFFLSVDASYNVILPEFREIYKNSYRGVTAHTGIYFGIFTDIPVIKNMGFAALVQYVKYEKKDNPVTVDSELSQLAYAPGFFGYIQLNRRFDIHLFLYCGMAKTAVRYSDINENYSAISDNLFLTAGITPRVYLTQHFFTETGVFYKHILYDGYDFRSVQFNLGFGIVL